jgi:hypothetical protein
MLRAPGYHYEAGGGFHVSCAYAEDQPRNIQHDTTYYQVCRFVWCSQQQVISLSGSHTYHFLLVLLLFVTSPPASSYYT